MRKIFILSIIILIILISIIIYFYRRNINNRDINISYISYSYSGDSIGSHLYLEYDVLKNKVTINRLSGNGEEEIINTYKVNDDFINKFKDTVKNSNYKKWDKLKNSEIIALDEGVSYINITVDGVKYSVSNDKEMDNYKIFSVIKSNLLSIEK